MLTLKRENGIHILTINGEKHEFKTFEQVIEFIEGSVRDVLQNG